MRSCSFWKRGIAIAGVVILLVLALGSRLSDNSPAAVSEGADTTSNLQSSKALETDQLPAVDADSSGGSADIIKHISLDKSQVCPGEDVVVTAEVTHPTSPQGVVDVYINGQLGNPQILRFTGVTGPQVITVLAATPEKYFDTDQVTVDVVACEEEVEFLDVAVSPSIFGEYLVDFVILNADSFSGQNPVYVWDFGDGQSLETKLPNASHSYAASMRSGQASTDFEARIILRREGQDDLAASKTVTLWNMSSYAKLQGFVQPTVDSDRYLQKSGDQWEGTYTIINQEDEPIRFTSRQVTFHPCNPDGDSVALSAEDISLKVGRQGRAWMKLALPASQVTSDLCTVEVIVKGQSQNGQSAFASVYFDIQPNPYKSQAVDDKAMRQLLNQIAEQNLVEDPVHITQEDLYRLAGEGMIILPPSSDTLTGFKANPKLRIEAAASLIGQSCQPGDKMSVPGIGTYDDSDDGFVKTGTWWTAFRSEAYESGITYTISSGAEASFMFNGSGITLLYMAGPTFGNANVFIDDNSVATINMNAESTIYQQSWSSAALSAGIHTLTIENATAGRIIDFDAVIVSGPSRDLTCQATGDWIYSPPFIANARKGDVVLSASCGLVGAMLRKLSPPQLYSHTGMMTQDYYQITHSTASEQRYQDNIRERYFFDLPLGFNETVLKWGWPGVVTESVDQAFNGQWMVDPGGKWYWMVGFHAYPVRCQGDTTLVWPLVVKPPPGAPPAVRELLHQAADQALESSGHYRFYTYSAADIVYNPSKVAPGSVPGVGGTRPTVCSQFVWYTLRQVNTVSPTKIILEGGELEANDVANGAEIFDGILDGLYLYGAQERLAAGTYLYNYVYNQAYDMCHGNLAPPECRHIARHFGNQFANCFANDDCSDTNDSTAWQSPGQGVAVSPDDILFWDDWTITSAAGGIGVYGYSEPLIYRAGEYIAETVWQYSEDVGALQGRVLYQGNPVKDASVNLAGQEVFSDADGNFSYDDLSTGKYELSASRIISGNLKSVRQIVEINAGETTYIDLVLQDPLPSQRVFIKGSSYLNDDEAFQSDETALCEFQAAPMLDPLHPHFTVNVDSCCAGDEVRTETRFILDLRSQDGLNFYVSQGYVSELSQGIFSNKLRLEFETRGMNLSDSVVVTSGGSGDPYRWRIYDRNLSYIFYVKYSSSMLQVTQKIFSNDINVALQSWFYEGTECDDNDQDDYGYWGPHVIPNGQQLIFQVGLSNEDDWEPDWSYANLNFTVQNNPDLFSDIIDLQLSKDDGGVTAYPRDTIVYTLKYANLSEQDAVGVRIVETVPNYTTFEAAASSPGWDCQPDGNAGSLCTMEVGRVSSAASYAPLTFAVRVNNPPPISVDQIYNSAYITDDGSYGADIFPQNNFANDVTPVLPDTIAPTLVSITRAGPNPSKAYSVDFTVTFSEPIIDVDPDDFSLAATGLVGSSVTTVNATADPAVYTVTTDTGSSSGTLRLDVIASPTIQDPSFNALVGPYTEGEIYTIDHDAPVVMAGGIYGFPGELPIYTDQSYLYHFNYFEIYFSETLSQDGFGDPTDQVTNPANYMLVRAGPDYEFDTSSCMSGLGSNDQLISTETVTYDPVRSMVKFEVNGGRFLPSGLFRLFICGTTSLVDLAGNPLNNGTDTVITFLLFDPRIPDTGFPQGYVTSLPPQPAEKAYYALEDPGMMLEIPAMGVTLPIVGVPLTGNGWDVTWLGGNAGYLQGTAFPTWAGNTVITAHVWDAFNNPGPFARLKDLKYGDKFFIHAWGQTFAYEVRDNSLVWPANISSLFKHEELDWVTLFTCEGYEILGEKYSFRRVVRAVLVSVSSD